MNSRLLLGFGFAILLPCMAHSEIPQHDGYEHLGVQSCGASSCHGSASVRNTYGVLQNEYITWARHDLHSRAYSVLKNEQSQRIAKNLGLESAHTAKICLDCHTDYVPRDRRGLQFQLSDGVACEACHGGAEKWLGVHIGGGGDKHAASLAAGMYPTEDPEARAELCLSCHLGTADKFASHEIMGAGHPRLSFDLQKFTDIQPRHYRVDADYRARKDYVEDTRVWAIGQVSAARHYLGLLQSARLAGDGLFPELGLFDCYACHQSFSDYQWQSSQLSATPPGTVQINDSSLVMSYIVASILPGSSDAMRSAIRELHAAAQTSAPAVRAAAAKLDGQLARLADRLREQEFGRLRNQQIIDALANAVAEGRLSDYSDAEQATMALDVYSGVTGQYKNEVDSLYAAVADVDAVNPNRFDPKVFAAVFKNTATSLRPPESMARQPAPVEPPPERPAPVRPAPVAEQPAPVRQQPKKLPAPVAAPAIGTPAQPVRTKPETPTPAAIDTTGLSPDAIAPTHFVNADALRVRFRPEPDAGIRGLLYFGDEVQVLNPSGEWSRVTYVDADGVTRRGWVISRLLTERMSGDPDARRDIPATRPAARPATVTRPADLPAASASSAERIVPTHTVTANALRVRFTPDSEAGIRGQLFFGDQVQLLNTSGDWSRVTYTDADGVTQRGWVGSSFLDPI